VLKTTKQKLFYLGNSPTSSFSFFLSFSRSHVKLLNKTDKINKSTTDKIGICVSLFKNQTK